MSKPVEGIDQRTDSERDRRTVHGIPLVWGGVPPQNPTFSGREELLEQLGRRLSLGGAVVLPPALHGMGGIGKTQIAIEYIYRHLGDYDLIWWVRADEEDHIHNDLAALADQLRLPRSAKVDTAVPAVLEALRIGRPIRRWLLVYDSAGSPKAVREFLPTHGSGDIIITSRNPGWSGNPHSIKVSPFRSESAMASLEAKEKAGKYDVFLCYSSRDRERVLEIAEILRRNGVRPWIDVVDVPPGCRWQEEITNRISDVASAAVFIGRSGLAQWRDAEIQLILNTFLQPKKPVIPVILEGRKGNPRVPGFLGLGQWVDMRLRDPDPIAQLIWGITGEQPPA